MPTEPPVPLAPPPSTTVAETTLPHAPADPLAVSGAGPSAPVEAPPAPPAAPVSLAPVAAPVASVPAGEAAARSVPALGELVAPAASVPDAPAPASASSPKAASATTVDPAPMVAPPGAGPAAPAQLPAAPVVQPSRPPSPDRRLSRPHSPAPQQERETSRRRRNSPRRHQYRPPVTMADLQREESRAVREERAAQSQSSSLRAGSRLHLPPVPPVAGVEFVAAGGGAAAQQSHHIADEGPLLFLTEALQPPQTRVPEATLGQLHRLAESLHALLLIQVLAHSSLPVIPPATFRGRQRDTCLDAADQLASLLAPVLAAPAEGGAAAAGQLDEAVRGLRRHLRAGSGAAAIGASTLVVRELWRSLTGVLHALGAHRM
ncbi:unnamed protein product [Closterium sp. Naga37s-1]|nr:unnamed protein product [Closterium sp. Naga37s-1]